MITIYDVSNYIIVEGLERHKDGVIYSFPKKMSAYVEDADSFVIRSTYNKEVVIIPFEEILAGNVVDNNLTPVAYNIPSLRTFLQNCTGFNSAGSIPDSVSLNLNGNTLEILDDEGSVIAFQDLSMFLDDTNLARVVAVSVDASGQATFTRDDGSTFPGDLSVLLDNTNLDRIESGSIVGNNIELVRNDGSIVNVDISNLVALETQVTLNTTDIAALQVEQLSQQVEIDSNTANIAAAQGDITALQAQVGTNTADIAQLQTDLAAETANRIAGDTALQGQIDLNDIDIAALQAEDVNLQNQITTNSNDIAQEILDRTAADTALQGQITTNAGDIAQEILDRTAADAAIQAQVTANDTDITSLQAQVSANDADILALQGVDTGLQAQITANDTDIAQLNADLAQEVLDRTNADTALQGQITANDGDILTLQNEQTVQDAAIALNTAKVSFPEAPLDGQQYGRENGAWTPILAEVKDYFQGTPTAAQNTATINAADVLLQVTENKNSDAGVFSVVGGTDVVVNKAGDFKFTVNVGGDTATGAREELAGRLQRDSGGGFVDIPLSEGGTQGYSYHRNLPAGRDVLKIDVILTVAAGDAFRVVLNSPTNGVDVINVGTNFIIEEK